MATLILAAVNPDNTPHGYNLTFAFPMLLFIIIGGVLYLLFSRPHRRIPARSLTLPARSSAVPGPESPQSHGAHLAGSLDAEPAGPTPATDTDAPGTADGTADGTAESQRDPE